MKVLVMGLRRGLSRGSPAAPVHVRYLCIGIQCRFSHLSSVKQSIRQASAVIMSNITPARLSNLQCQADMRG